MKDIMKEDNILKINDMTIKKGNRIVYDYEYSGIWKKVLTSNKFFIEYDFDVSNVPDSIKVIPFLSNILPIAWYFNATILIDEIDKKFWDSLPHILEGYKEMYPDINFGFNIKANTIVDNTENNYKNVGTLFSGGVDSFSTLLGHIKETPELITVLGADISLNDKEGEDSVKNYITEIGQKYNLKVNFIKSNLKDFINNKELDNNAMNDDWWHAIQHGFGIIGLTSVIAYKEKLKTVYIAASYSDKHKKIKCASDPRIDNKIKFINCDVIHDQYNYTRQDKLNLIINKSELYNEKPFLRVCWQIKGGKNCSICEKCARTIYGIIAAGGNPNDYGFIFNEKINRKIKNYIKYKYNISELQIVFWKEIQDEFYNKRVLYENSKSYRWIYRINFDKIKYNFIRRLRKYVGKLLHKLGRKYTSGKI